MMIGLKSRKWLIFQLYIKVGDKKAFGYVRKKYAAFDILYVKWKWVRVTCNTIYVHKWRGSQ